MSYFSLKNGEKLYYEDAGDGGDGFKAEGKSALYHL